MNKSLLQELDPTEKYSKKLPLYNEDIFPNVEHPQRANSDSPSFINNNNNSNEFSFNQQIKNSSNIISLLQQDNPINKLEKENENSSNYMIKNSKDNSQLQYNKSNNITTHNFLNSNFFGFKGRSPYSIPNPNNMMNNNISKKNTNITKQETNKSIKNQKNNQNVLNKNQKKNDTALVTQLKDKILEYRCSVCNFVANEYEELHNHLIIKKHLISKKMMKGKKRKFFYKKENKMNQTLMHPSKVKKSFEKKVFCKNCGKKFDSIFGLNAHLNAHKYKCEICFKLFNTKDELMKHNDMELLYKYKNADMNKKNNVFKSPEKKEKKEIDDWEEISSNKKEKNESDNDEEIYKNDFEQSYVFIEDNDENFDFNKMVKITNKNI